MIADRDSLGRIAKKSWTPVFEGGICKIPLGIDYSIIDTEYYELIKNIGWSKNNKGYVCGRFDKNFIKIHNIIMGSPTKGYETSHKNSNKLDNRRCNLEIVIQRYNRMNSFVNKNNKLKHKYIFNVRSKFRVVVDRHHIGYYNTIKEAITARNLYIEQHLKEVIHVFSNQSFE